MISRRSKRSGRATSVTPHAGSDRPRPLLDRDGRAELESRGPPGRHRAGPDAVAECPGVRAAQPGRRRRVHRSLGREVHVQPVAAGHRHSRRRHRRQRGHRRRSAWTPLLVTPPFPDYIAGHTTTPARRRRCSSTCSGPSQASSSRSRAPPRRVWSKPTQRSKTSRMASWMPACGAESIGEPRAFAVGPSVKRSADMRSITFSGTDDDDDPRGSHHPPR